MVSHLYNISLIFRTIPFMVDFIVYIRVIRVIRSTDHPLCSFVIMSFCLAENHLSPSVIMLFCLKKSTVFVRPSVILSQKIPLSLFVLMLLCLPFILSVSC